MTTTDIGWTGDTNPDSSGFSKPSNEDFNRSTGRLPHAPLSGGPRESSKSLGDYGTWSADVPVNASKVKSSGTAPID